jgi:hypothetical protein
MDTGDKWRIYDSTIPGFLIGSYSELSQAQMALASLQRWERVRTRGMSPVNAAESFRNYFLIQD